MSINKATSSCKHKLIYTSRINLIAAVIVNAHPHKRNKMCLPNLIKTANSIYYYDQRIPLSIVPNNLRAFDNSNCIYF